MPSSLIGLSQLFGSALGCYIAFPVLFTFGQAETTTAHAALIIATMPIFTGLFAALVERRLPSKGWWIGSGLAFTGVLILIGSRFGYEEPGVTLRGDILCLASLPVRVSQSSQAAVTATRARLKSYWKGEASARPATPEAL